MAKPSLADLLADAPSNWGKWGDNDEIGAVNYLTSSAVLSGVGAVEDGRVFALGIQLNREDGDAISPGRVPPQHWMNRDKGAFEAGKIDLPFLQEKESADDTLLVGLHGTTHVDALGHVWYDDTLYNGFDAGTTKGGLDRCDVEPIAQHGVVGRGVLLDVARYRGVDRLGQGEEITFDELLDCADEQGVEIEPRDTILLRTGWLEGFYEGEREQFEQFDEPGITHSDDLVEWFHEMEIPVLGTDTFASEKSIHESGIYMPLHPTFIRDQGILLTETMDLSELGADCADDDRYSFMYVCSPLKIVRATGSPVNPLAIK